MERTFGKIVKSLREERKLSREDLCGDESELSVRQLTRLEQDQSRPTLTKIQYIAKGLGVPSYKLMADYKELPARYLNLKYLLIRNSLFRLEDKIAEKELYLAEIYEEFYEDLPEDEQVAVDVMQSYVDVLVTHDSYFGQAVLGDYFAQVKLKQSYEVNDLLLINLYFYCCNLGAGSWEADLYDSFVEKLLSADSYLLLEQLFVLLPVLISCAAAGLLYGRFDKMEILLSKMKDLMEKTKDYQSQPVIFLTEWKCHLLIKKDKATAEEVYRDAVQFARLIGEKGIEKRLEDEWLADLAKEGDYQQEN